MTSNKDNSALEKVSCDLITLRLELESLMKPSDVLGGIAACEVRLNKVDTTVDIIDHKVRWIFVILGILLLSQIITWGFRLAGGLAIVPVGG
jgi:hypothetical protein